ncbi:hypothetical protein BC835DRAFT_1486299 [Cytidiella melzeri]|nr:hypothetical protein BC835DRAFT_1486299 [Cytidiella melzeri]
MQAVQDALIRILESLPRLIRKETLDEHVVNVLASLDQKVLPETRKTQWEFVLRQEIFALAATEGLALKNPATTYYDDLTNRLDLVLALTDKDACEQILPFNILYDLLETQTIASCSHIFSWIELRAEKLTAGMIPQKGKALVLLRTLNDLLRRLSKMGSTTLFCGRILTFLSQVFPLGERSGVNLRGEYGPVWEGPGLEQHVLLQKQRDEDVTMEDKPKSDEMQVDDDAKKDGKTGTAAEDGGQQQKDDFYRTFWSLQLPFSKPSIFAKGGTFATFQDSVSKVLPVIKEATAKERALMGSKANSNTTSLKRRRDPDIGLETAGQDYFFAKHLTSPDLLDLEFLFQLLILLHHLLTFTDAAKATWVSPRNRSLQIEFTLKPADTIWVQEVINKVGEELRQTTPSGRAFAETVHVILEREKNWVKWKNELCAPFDKMPWAEEIEVEVDGMMRKEKVGIEEATKDSRKRRREDPDPWPHELGTEALTEIWMMGYRDLADLKHPFHPGDVQDFVKKIKIEDAKIENRRKQLAKAAERTAASRAKAAVVATASSAPVTGPKPTAIIPASSAPPATLSLHPSLPAKPGTAPARPPPPVASEPGPTPIIAPTPIPAPAPAPAVVEVVPPPDDLITQYEESSRLLLQNKQRWSWLALRTAREQYLQHFGKIGTGDVLLLAQEIEKEKAEKENPIRGEIANTESRDERGTSPMVASTLTASGVPAVTAEDAAEPTAPPPNVQEAEGDIGLERREHCESQSRAGDGPEGSPVFKTVTDQIKSNPLTLLLHLPHQRAKPKPKPCIFDDSRSSIHLRLMPSVTEEPLKRVLVTGGAGYIGSHVIHSLQETRRYKVISIDNHHNAHPKSLSRVSQLARDALPSDASEKDKDTTVIDCHLCDLTKPDQVREVFAKYGKSGIWGVIHIAAYKAVGESTQIPLTYYENNVSATVYLLQIMSEFDCHRMVYSSSATVYGTPPVIPIPETTRLQADSPYGKTKVMCETILQDLCSSDTKWRAISLRYFNPAGAHPSGTIGEDPKGRPGNLLPLLAHMAVGRVKDAKLRVFGNDYPTPDGTCVRDYLHVLDLARGHTRALEVLADGSSIFDNCPTEARYKAYNLGKGKGLSVLQIVEAMRKATGFDYQYEIIGRRRGDVPDLTADPSLAEKELGFKAPQDLETMCRDLWNWQTKNPYGYDDAPVKENGTSEST